MNFLEMEIKDSNKLIAEFMGATIIETYLNPQKEVDHFLMDMGQDRTVHSRYIANTTMKYHQSWDWLMPVLDRIESLANLKDDNFYYSVKLAFHRTSKDDYGIDKHPYWEALMNDEDTEGLECPKLYESYYTFGISKIGEYSINKGNKSLGESINRIEATYTGVLDFIILYNEGTLT